jgi:23S rRNA (uracil1939-C5)-methyltransferase
MIEKVLEFGEIAPGDSVLDLFCGMGNFSIPFALQGATVAGYEGQGAAIRAAIRNSYENGVEDKTSFSKKPVHQACEELVAAGRTFDCTIIDPPRQGGPQLADQLYKLTKKKLIYVSCDPATLIRDLNDLTTKGFAIEQIQPIDMFPQTHHIETIVQLKRQ